MESLGIIQTHVIYESETNEIYFARDEFIDVEGVRRFFYCVVTEHNSYSLSDGEGEILHYIINKAFKKFGLEGIEVELLNFPSLHQRERMH